MRFHFAITTLEWEEWIQNYLPPADFKKDDLILDVGARDGDTAAFFVQHGFTNLRLVEPKVAYFAWLDENVDELRLRGATIEVRKKPFSLEDLEGVKFAKFDCEGCEQTFDYHNIGIPYVVEKHAPNEPDPNGVYGYAQSDGYDRGTGISQR